MNKILILCLLIVTSNASFSQQIDVPRLLDMLNWSARQIDTTLKKDGYLLMKKDADEAGTLFQYSWFDRQQDGKAVVRSFNYMDVAVRELKSRLITYRTYSKDEYQDIASWLLANNYQNTGHFDFDESKHTLYSNGKNTIRVKVITTKLSNGRSFVAYELEIGK